VPAAERTVTKESVNKGRKFWTCDAKACDFFEWQDGPSSAGAGSRAGAGAPAAPRPAVPAKRAYAQASVRPAHRRARVPPLTPRAQADDDGPGPSILAGGRPRMCKCELTAVQRTVVKEGPNTGRKFWRCPNESDKAKCAFFEWDDEPRGAGGPVAAGGAGASFGGAGGSAGATDECYKVGARARSARCAG
jgi:DNA topoisomerase-3